MQPAVEASSLKKVHYSKLFFWLEMLHNANEDTAVFCPNRKGLYLQQVVVKNDLPRRSTVFFFLLSNGRVALSFPVDFI